MRRLYRLSEYPDAPPLETFNIGFGSIMNNHLRLFAGEFLVVTGIPGHNAAREILRDGLAKGVSRPNR